MQSDIGVIGLAVMGRNLILNMNDHGYSVTVYNRTVAKVDEFINDTAAGRATIIPTYSLVDFAANIKKPRKIMLMIKAGNAVDDFIEQLLPLLDKGDLIIDGGNSHFTDTNRRTAYLESKGLFFIGTGISGGEEGARHGPSIMPGGSAQAWPLIQDCFTSISAKTADGTACCSWVGPGGAGHYVKMVHNGIEYGDMQLISEACLLLKNVLNLDAHAIHIILAQWNKTELESYLIEITRDIFAFADADGTMLVDNILDAAGQKGTGKWTSNSAFDLGVPLTLIAEAVFARSLSSLKDERIIAAQQLPGPALLFLGDKQQFVNDLCIALIASKAVSYTQGFMLLSAASQEYHWNLNFGEIALLWRGGCIIRSVFLDHIKNAFVNNTDLANLLLDDYFKTIITTGQQSWRTVVATAALQGIAVPAMSAALSFYDGYRSARGGANIIQAQRDYFGAHTYERTDQPRGKYFHTNWTGLGGTTASGTYSA